MEHTIIDSMKMRRSVYHIGKNLPISEEQLLTIVQDAVQLAPSAFDSQSSRLIIVYGDENDWLWNLVWEKVKPFVTEEQQHATREKLKAFNSGSGTILFFEEMAIVRQLEKDFPLYSENFGLWSQHASALTQFAVWTALGEQRVGASLQHYGNLIEADVREHYNLSDTWSLIAQMPFGSIESAPPQKRFSDITDRVLVRGVLA